MDSSLVTAIIGGIVIALAVFVYWSGTEKNSTAKTKVQQKKIPGPQPATSKDGNMKEIAKAGSLAEFLVELHKEYGPIATFWLKETQIVSISSPELYRQVSHLFDRPAVLFKMAEPIIGAESIQFRNGESGQQARKLHDRSFSHSKVVGKLSMFQEIGEEFCTKWEKLADSQEHIPLSRSIFSLVMQAFTRFALGDYFIGSEAVDTFLLAYEKIFYIMEYFLLEGKLETGSEQDKSLQVEINNLKKMVSDIIKQRQESEIDPEDYIFIDTLLNEYDNEDHLFCDVISYLLAGSHTTSYFVFWSLYHLSCHQEMQDKVSNEIREYYSGGPITWEILSKMTYLQSVMDETLRITPMGPYAARYSETDLTLGGYVVPKEMPILLSLQTTLWDDKLWPQAQTFNPDRFSNRTKIPAYSFEPFGVGKRKCPGYRLSEIETQTLLTVILSRFKVSFAPGQKRVGCLYGIATKPDEEVMVVISKRDLDDK